LDASVEAGFVVSISNGTTECDVGTNTAVVRSLLAGVAIVGPAEGLLSELGRLGNKSVFLLDTVPSLLLGDFLMVPNLFGVVSEVGVCGDEFLASLVLPVEALTDDKNVVLSSEGISVDPDGLQNDLRLLSGGLVAGRSIVVPFGQFRDVLNRAIESASL